MGRHGPKGCSRLEKLKRNHCAPQPLPGTAPDTASVSCAPEDITATTDYSPNTVRIQSAGFGTVHLSYFPDTANCTMDTEEKPLVFRK